MSGRSADTEAGMIAERTERLGGRLRDVRIAIGSVIFGQPDVINQTMVTLLSGGHVLLVGVPGLGKSRLVETLGTMLGLSTKRVQFTPDLTPADIVGREVLDVIEGRQTSRFIPGPVFCQLLMADEINRASPRTQSALLQAMQERHVTVRGTEHTLPTPFHVLATQNPLEHEGTYPLPEAQLDRFLMQVDVTYPDLAAEKTMLLATTGVADTHPGQALTPDELISAQSLIRRLTIGDKVVDTILALVRNTRPETSDDEQVRRHVAWGPGPRAGQALMLACRAQALIRGDGIPTIDDVAALAHPVLRHRMSLNFSARADGITLAQVIDSALQRLKLKEPVG